MTMQSANAEALYSVEITRFSSEVKAWLSDVEALYSVEITRFSSRVLVDFDLTESFVLC